MERVVSVSVGLRAFASITYCRSSEGRLHSSQSPKPVNRKKGKKKRVEVFGRPDSGKVQKETSLKSQSRSTCNHSSVLAPHCRLIAKFPQGKASGCSDEFWHFNTLYDGVNVSSSVFLQGTWWTVKGRRKRAEVTDLTAASLVHLDGHILVSSLRLALLHRAL